MRGDFALNVPYCLANYYDLDIGFEWDALKAAANLEKHGVSFEEAKTLFNAPLAAIFDDQAHSSGKSREIIIGILERIDCCWFVLLNVLTPSALLVPV